jgi:hypothetical protein
MGTRNRVFIRKKANFHATITPILIVNLHELRITHHGLLITPLHSRQVKILTY